MATKVILDVFGAASGLHVNYGKSSATLVFGDLEDSMRSSTFLDVIWAVSPANT